MTWATFWTPQRNAKLRHLFNAGDAAKMIAWRMGDRCTPGAIYTQLGKLGLSLRRRDGYKPRREVDHDIERLVREGATFSQIAAETGLARGTVVNRTSELGLTIRIREKRVRPVEPGAASLGERGRIGRRSQASKGSAPI